MPSVCRRILNRSSKPQIESVGFLSRLCWGKPTHGWRIQIRFPRKRQGEIRVSEQEARFVLTGQLARSQLLYSVETPTSLTYQFTGRLRVRGQTDVTVYTPSGDGMWNLEFKSIMASRKIEWASCPSKRTSRSCFVNLRPAYWFHTFEGVE